MVSLEQHDTGGEKMTGEDHQQIGFHIMRVSIQTTSYLHMLWRIQILFLKGVWGGGYFVGVKVV